MNSQTQVFDGAETVTPLGAETCELHSHMLRPRSEGNFFFLRNPMTQWLTTWLVETTFEQIMDFSKSIYNPYNCDALKRGEGTIISPPFNY